MLVEPELAKTRPESSGALADGSEQTLIRLSIRASLKRTGKQMKFVVEGVTNSAPADTTLIRLLPPDDRRALARAFVAKAVLGVPTTTALIERLDVDKSLRRILGWERRLQVPSEATFSRAFAEFAQGDLPDKMQAALIERSLGGRIVGVIARDATEIEAREKPVKTEPNDKRSFRRVRSLRGVWRAHYTPKLKKRTALLRKLKDVMPSHHTRKPRPPSRT